MEAFFIGTWESDSSNIPDYKPGREWLHFMQAGTHTMELLHPGQDKNTVKIDFTIQQDKEMFRFIPTKEKSDGSVQEGWLVSISRISRESIAVTPDLPNHGFTTIYRRVSPKTESSQVVQRMDADARR